jgi:hypothetical protein
MHYKQNHIYVGLDLHKDTHTAVIIDCWNEKLETIVIENKPSDFTKLLDNRKVSEWKTKVQALICVMRRLVNILYGMMKNKTEYVMPNVELKEAV